MFAVDGRCGVNGQSEDSRSGLNRRVNAKVVASMTSSISRFVGFGIVGKQAQIARLVCVGHLTKELEVYSPFLLAALGAIVVV